MMKNRTGSYLYNSQAYVKYRPVYPVELYKYITSLAPQQDMAWDHATGNGQVAVGISPYFKQILATDISETQLENADKSYPNIQYQKVANEITTEDFPSLTGKVDLITVGTGAHWLPQDTWIPLVKSSLKENGIYAIWSYLRLYLVPPGCSASDSPEQWLSKPEGKKFKEAIDSFLIGTLRPYFPWQVNLIFEEYVNIPFPFEPLPATINQNPNHPWPWIISTEWNWFDLWGYFSTCSPIGEALKNGKDYLNDPQIIENFTQFWGPREKKYTFVLPLVVKIGRNKK